MASKILLTGAAGFIGSHVARRLVAEGCDVYAVVRPQSTAWRLRGLEGAIQRVNCDLTLPGAAEQCAAQTRPDMCVHLAWDVVPGQYLHSLRNVEWVTASLRLAGALAEHGCSRFIGAGTCLEYDASHAPLAETDPTRPTNLYAASKLGLALILERLADVTGMRVAWLRFFYLFGPLEDERRLVPSVILALLEGRQAAVSAGKQVRDFLHVADVASAVWAVARSDLSGPVNIGSGHPVTVGEVAGHLGAMLQRSDLLAPGAVQDDPSAPPYVCADIRRLFASTGWTPQYDLDSGLRDTVRWWQDSRRSKTGLE